MRLFFIITYLLFSNIAKGQSDSTYNESWYITYSPSAIINIHPGVQFGIEKALNNFRTIEIEGARLFDISSNNGVFQREIVTGYRIKLGYKVRDFNKKLFFF